MPLLVGRRIRQGAVNVNRDYGLPLLFFSVICFDGGNRRTLRPAVTKLLLDHDADARQTCPNLEGFKKIDALAFLVYNCREYKGELDADDVEQIVDMLLQKGANPNGKLGNKLHYKLQWAEPRSEEPLLFAIAKLGLPRYNLFLILKALITRGANPNARDPQGNTLLAILFTHGVAVHIDDWLWLLDHGAKISESMVGRSYNDPGCEHALQDPACKKLHYCDWRARNAAWERNPSWSYWSTAVGRLERWLLGP